MSRGLNSQVAGGGRPAKHSVRHEQFMRVVCGVRRVHEQVTSHRHSSSSSMSLICVQSSHARGPPARSTRDTHARELSRSCCPRGRLRCRSIREHCRQSIPPAAPDLPAVALRKSQTPRILHQPKMPLKIPPGRAAKCVQCSGAPISSTPQPGR